ncbi:uncharacterized protein LOC132732937 [Ruditapes philippinarum]|uniref:uncharacterized protein LOC132732937 n=1 Tax=Ruditapes philippinarum TaxID=129788 RepID=UPI00295B2728|nr:uncharacterized protein LOC132732937 [Ruditapes philippinarum]
MTNTEDKVQCSFVIGKSLGVAPLKKVTVPRFELTAATVAVRTNKMLKDELEMKIDRSVFWTDSMSVLRYVRNTTSRFHTFVANRLMIIHEGSNVSDWRYINTKLNPADIASRGLPVENSLWGERWIEAPKFLEMTEENWPSLRENNFELRDDDPEVKKVKANLTCVKSEDGSKLENAGTEKLINYYSSWYKLKKGVAWILKYRNELRKRVHQQGQKGVVEPEESARLSVDDLLEAEKAIVMYTQRTVFKEEIELLKKGHHVSRKSSIRKLDPYLDGGLLRVGGRLHESSLPAESKHPK